MKNTKIALIGCGNLGVSILRGLVDESTYPSENIVATRRNPSELKAFESFGVMTSSDNGSAVDQSDLIILAVKPYNVVPVLHEIKSHFVPGKHTLVSVATGVSIAEIREVIGGQIPVFRAMPNTAADVKESITCICSDGANDEQVAKVGYFFELIGSTLPVSEELMESATILGSCGIAYVLRFMRAMVQGGIEIGFDAKTATAIVNQTVRGAAGLLIERKQHPEYEIDKVTTPRGCTIVGLNEMEHNGFSSSLIKGIVASFEKIEKKT